MSAQAATLQEHAAHILSRMAGVVSPWWRFRMWARLAGSGAYTTLDDSQIVTRPIWPHGYKMTLRVSDWMERFALHSGRYYQDDLIALLQRSLKAGDTFVDIGANLGFTTLTAARLVGESSQVISAEPNSVLVTRLVESLQINAIKNVQVHHLALGETEGFIDLVNTGHHGTSYIDLANTGEGSVRLARGDNVFRNLKGAVFVKIDVEGAEVGVLRGLPQLLARPNTRFLVEICEDQLNRFGGSAAEVFEIFRSNGYRPWLARLSPISRECRIRPIDGPLPRRVYDAFFVPAGTNPN